ncbi:alpha/beta fold hydrolase [Pararhodobacter oceanensis]|uniref:alpha/beta fold hydrolase n=1 Tax=Pararhodobacter oceanensis TaxID=2172121 RepID=UPI003A8EABA8
MSIDWDKGSGRIEAGGKSLEWQSWGRPEAESPVIVMLHEGLGSVGLWREFPAAVAEATGCAVVAYSRAGYGFSDPAERPFPVDYMTREAVAVLPEVLRAIGAAQYILLGHSDGATIAAEYAGRGKDFSIRGLILIAPHFFTEPMGLAAIASAAESFATTDLPQRMARHHTDAEATFRGWNEAWLNPEFATWNVADVIDYIRIPALVIQGAQDQYGTRAQVDAIAEGSYAPVEVLMLDGCQHAPHLEDPAPVLEAIASFTTRLQRIEAAGPVPA